MRRMVTLAGMVLTLAVLGCGGESGPPRMRLSGAAKLDGQPIVFGDVVLTPDARKGNSGTQGIAPIRDGKFDTAWTGGKGFAGGATVVHVTAFSAEGGKLLCEYEYAADLPKDASGTFDIEVPRSALKKGNGKEI